MWVLELLVCFHDVAFLPSRASFSTAFLSTISRGKSLKTITCLKTVLGGNQGHAPCKILSLQQSLFFVSVEFNGDHKTAYGDEVKSGHP